MEKITKASLTCINIICEFESFSAKPYLCPAGVATIGYGTTRYNNGNKVSMNDTEISKEYAMTLLKSQLIQYEKSVDAFCRDDINQNQFDALVSFCYNVGGENLRRSTLLRFINTRKSHEEIKSEFLKWNKANGKVLKGLTRRREKEANLFNT
jgi:lysozyme